MALHLEKDTTCKYRPNSFKNVCCKPSGLRLDLARKRNKRQNAQHDEKMQTQPGKSCNDSCWLSCSQMAAR